MNHYKEQAPEPEQKTPPRGRFSRLHDFDFSFNKKNASRLIPFILYVSVWAIAYIANHHYGEKTLKDIYSLRKEMKDLKADYYTQNAELSNKSIQSEVAKMVEPLGLKELRHPPKRIKIPTE
jgi:hypothetical protein